jgi:hypothetical protein
LSKPVCMKLVTTKKSQLGIDKNAARAVPISPFPLIN